MIKEMVIGPHRWSNDYSSNIR